MNTVLGLFAKAPLPGHAKTRLGQEVGMVQAASIYETVLRSQLRKLRGPLPEWRRILFVADEADRAWFEERTTEWELQIQVSGDLGARLSAAFEAGFSSGAERVIVIGSDVPDLTTGHLIEAERSLADHDLVLGPSLDGGYYLIGQRPPGHDLFSGIPWSTSSVLALTIERANTLALRTRLLAALRDIDTLEDWRRHQSRAPLKTERPRLGLAQNMDREED